MNKRIKSAASEAIFAGAASRIDGHRTNKGKIFTKTAKSSTARIKKELKRKNKKYTSKLVVHIKGYKHLNVKKFVKSHFGLTGESHDLSKFLHRI